MQPLKIAPEVLLDSIYNGIVAIDENGVIIYFNKTAERIFNLPAQTLGSPIKRHLSREKNIP